MKLFKNIDDKFLEIGFNKIIETKYGVSYERINNKYNYMQKIDIIHKRNGEYIAKSYDATNSNSQYSPVVGINKYEMKLILQKMKKMKLHNK